MSKSDKTVIIADFSKTLTDANNPTTWSVFARSGLLGEEYTKQRNKYYEIYHKFELEQNVEKTKQWWAKHLELFKKYGLTKRIINQITGDENYFKERKGLEKFIETLKNKGVKLFIVSSGVSDFIKSYLSLKGLLNDGIKIYGNDLVFDETGKVIGFDEKTIITTLNKNDHNFDLEGYGKVILLGDDVGDLKMYKGDCLKIGLCDKNEVQGYDLYLGKDGNLNKVLEYI